MTISCSHIFLGLRDACQTDVSLWCNERLNRKTRLTKPCTSLKHKTLTWVDKLKSRSTHQICSLIFFPCNSTVLILKSIPVKDRKTHQHTYLLIIYEWAACDVLTVTKRNIRTRHRKMFKRGGKWTVRDKCFHQRDNNIISSWFCSVMPRPWAYQRTAGGSAAGEQWAHKREQEPG